MCIYVATSQSQAMTKRQRLKPSIKCNVFDMESANRNRNSSSKSHVLTSPSYTHINDFLSTSFFPSSLFQRLSLSLLHFPILESAFSELQLQTSCFHQCRYQIPKPPMAVVHRSTSPFAKSAVIVRSILFLIRIISFLSDFFFLAFVFRLFLEKRLSRNRGEKKKKEM